MTKAITNTINTANEYRLHISYFLMAVCVALVLAYCMSVYSVITKSAGTNSVLRQAQVLENSVKNLDTQYIKITSNMTKESLVSRGLTEGKVTAFITKSRTSDIVALR